MNIRSKILLGITCLMACAHCACQEIEAVKSKYFIAKDNGRIILAYKAFDDFLSSDRSWETYQRDFLQAYPEMQVVHDKQMGWGAIDPVQFRKDLVNYKRGDFERFFDQYDEANLNRLYDSVIQKAHTILPPVTDNPVDLCLFLPYGSCFADVGKNRSVIYISLYINPDDVPKIMAHEYAHSLHGQRCPEEPLTLRREIVSEGLAVYLTTLIHENLGLKNAIPFMPASSVDWCIEHEQQVKDSIQVELEDSSDRLFYRYVSDGSIAEPPKGFVQKTAYYAGFRIIEACVSKGMSLEEVCSLNSRAVIQQSGYFAETN